MTKPACRAHPLNDDGRIPNNPNLPLLVYPQALEFSSEQDAAAEVQDRFRANGWTGCWVNGIYDYHHYHATAHEVLGCFSGQATVLFGGENGVRIKIQAGDVVVIPAGVGHKNLGSSPDFGVVGAYPSGQGPDMKHGRPEERPQCLEDIRKTALPKSDPVCGEEGPLMEEWKVGKA